MRQQDSPIEQSYETTAKLELIQWLVGAIAQQQPSCNPLSRFEQLQAIADHDWRPGTKELAESWASSLSLALSLSALRRARRGATEMLRVSSQSPIEGASRNYWPNPRPPDTPQGQQEEKVRQRLVKQQDHLLTFPDYPEVDATNNLAERQLRPAVISRNLSCGNKTSKGATTWSVLASLAATCQQRGDLFDERVAHAMKLQNSAA